MSGVGSEHPTFEPLRQALEAHVQAVSSDSHVMGDFIILAHIIDLCEGADPDAGEYILASSTQAPHVIDGLLSQIHRFSNGMPDDD